MPYPLTPTRAGGEEQHATRSPDSIVQHATAHRSVLLYSIADVFRLTPEEVLWSGYVLDSMLAPLLTRIPDDTPFAVRQELLHGTYSRSLDGLLSQSPQVNPREPALTTTLSDTPIVPVAEWVEVFLSPIRVSYALDPVTEARMRHALTRVLTDLGCDAPEPRTPAYLPSALRELRNTHRSN